jgi:hypothetical protein
MDVGTRICMRLEMRLTARSPLAMDRPSDLTFRLSGGGVDIRAADAARKRRTKYAIGTTLAELTSVALSIPSGQSATATVRASGPVQNYSGPARTLHGIARVCSGQGSCLALGFGPEGRLRTLGGPSPDSGLTRALHRN